MLTPNQVVQFREEGHVTVPGVVAAETVATLRESFEELVREGAGELEVTVEEYEAVVSQWTNLHERSSVFCGQLHHPSVVAIARQLLDADEVQLFHDHLISKPPGRSDTIPWHQDYPFWPVDRPKALSCWLALDDVDADAGSMYFMPGAHLEGEKPPVDFLRAPKDWGPRESQKVSTVLRAGDCVFHDCLSWHMSPPNRTGGPRRAFIAIMMASECRYAPTHSAWHPMNDLVSVEPGERFNRDRFPVLGREVGR